MGAAALLVSTFLIASSDVASAAPGHLRWVKRYNSGEAGTDFATDNATSPDGSTVYVTGASLTTSENHDVATIAYRASDGHMKWVQRYGGPFGDWDIGTAIAVSPDGSQVFVTGTSYSNTTKDDFITIAYAASDGKRLWVRRYTRASDTDDEGSAIVVSPDGQLVLVTGRSHSSTSSALATVAYAAADGTRLWHTVTADGINQPDAMVLSPDGTRVFVAGGVNGTTGNKDYVTVALDATTGGNLWEQRFNGAADGDDVATAIGIGPAGDRLFVTGRSDGATTLGNYTTIAYGADDGSERWVRGFAAPAHSYDDVKLAVAPNGSRIVVTGYGAHGNHDEFVTVAYGASGTKAWSDRYDGPLDKTSRAFDVAITRDSKKAIVTGQTVTVATSSYDVATIAYGVTNGPRLWVRRYDGPDHFNDRGGNSVAIAPNGSTAFVAGESEGNIDLDDYLTLAYSLK
jgi:hypothetical protein